MLIHFPGDKAPTNYNDEGTETIMSADQINENMKAVEEMITDLDKLIIQKKVVI